MRVVPVDDNEGRRRSVGDGQCGTPETVETSSGMDGVPSGTWDT